MLDINTKMNGSELTVALKGDLDRTSSPELDKMLDETDDSVESLVMDLGELQYISSAGLRIFVKLQKKMSGKGGMIIRNVQKGVMEIFDLGGFSSYLNIKK